MQAQYKIVGYYPNWAMYRNPAFKPHDINASLLTHINYAFVNYDISGALKLFDSWADTDYRSNWNIQQPYYGNFRELFELKTKNPHIKTLFSVGGWSLSNNFSVMAENAQTRSNFVKSCIAFCDTYNFDGVDIDWEFPGFAEHQGRAIDKQNYTLLLQELYTAAKAHSPQLLVTIAAPASTQHLVNMEIERIHNYVDWINVMAYDFHGPWDKKTGHNAPLYGVAADTLTVDAIISYYLSHGVPAQKLVLGLALYGRSFAQANSTPDGLNSTFSGPGKGTTAEAGVYFYYDIEQNLAKKYTSYWDVLAQVPYLHDPVSKEFVSYDNNKSLAIKTDYIKKNKLGGAMLWELGGDIRPSWDALTLINKSLL
jgi:chitinase